MALTPAGEKKARASDKIKELEDQIAKTRYNKKTQKAIGIYKAKVAELKKKEEIRKSSGGGGQGYSVRKTGDATVIMLGFPSVGKSTLLNALTNANSPVGHYEFTTLSVIPGLLEYKSAKIQILDVPGIVSGAASGRGRGKEVLAVIRNADMIMIILDVFHPQHFDAIMKEVYDVNVRLNQRKPDVRIRKTARGGIRIGNTVPLDIDKETIKSILVEMRINNADVLIRDKVDIDQFIDCVEGNKDYIPALVVVNKIDMADSRQIKSVKEEVKPDIMISADRKEGVEELKERIFSRLRFIRVFLKETGKKADLNEPLIMFEGCTIKDVCSKLHKDFVEKFKFARVWGRSVKFDGLIVKKLEHVLDDGDVVQLNIG
jgi:uncharacterized protein